MTATEDPDRIRPAVAAIFLRNRDEGDGESVLLVFDRRREAWTLPLGRVDPGESVAACVRREVREEADVTVSVDRLAGVYSDPATQVAERPSGERVQFVTTAVVCSVAASGPDPRGDSEETTDARFFPVEDLPEMAPLDRWVREAVASGDPALE